MRSFSHAVADIRFADDESSLICRCGEDIHTRYQEVLNEAFQDHRVKFGEVRRGVMELTGNMGENEFLRRQHKGLPVQRTAPSWVE